MLLLPLLTWSTPRKVLVLIDERIACDLEKSTDRTRSAPDHEPAVSTRTGGHSSPRSASLGNGEQVLVHGLRGAEIACQPTIRTRSYDAKPAMSSGLLESRPIVAAGDLTSIAPTTTTKGRASTSRSRLTAKGDIWKARARPPEHRASRPRWRSRGLLAASSPPPDDRTADDGGREDCERDPAPVGLVVVSSV